MEVKSSVGGYGYCVATANQASERIRMSDEQPFVPFSVRQGDGDVDAWNVLFEGTPPHLASSLGKWINHEVGAFSLAPRIQRQLRLDLGDQSPSPALIRAMAMADPNLMLDVIELVLKINSDRVKAIGNSQYVPSEQERTRGDIIQGVVALMEMLAEGSSAYGVDTTHPWHLVRRVDPTAEDAVKDVVQRAGEASGLIRSSWTATFSRNPDPDVAYRDAVFAVESVASMLFIPKDEEPTLGKAISHLASTVTKWSVAGLDDKEQASGETLLGMLRTVWQNHERHVGQSGKAPEGATQEEAEAVVFLAVTLVQWFERGLVKHR